MTAATPRTVVMVINYNRWDDSFRCLRSLDGRVGDAAVWLVDNGSVDDRSSEAGDALPGTRVLRWEQNRGWGGASNTAMRLAVEEGFELAYLINDDAEGTDGFLRATVDAAVADPELAAVGSRIAYREPAGFVHFDGTYHVGGQVPLFPSDAVRPADTLNAAGALIRLAAAERDGYFDDRFVVYHDETEWCSRMRAAGWRLAVADASVILHTVEGADMSGGALYFRTRNNFLLVRTTHPEGDGLQWAKDSAVSEAAAARRAGRHADWLAIACGLQDGLDDRFGPRTSTELRPLFALRLRWWTLRARRRGI